MYPHDRLFAGSTPGARRHRVGALCAVAVAAASLWFVSAVPASAATGAVSGLLYKDLNSNGQQDSGESGIAGISVGIPGTATVTTTGADGRYNLPIASGQQTISVLTGWLATQCPKDLNCAAGRGPQQDFAVQNQYNKATVTIPDAGTVANIDGGFLPDFGDPTGASTSSNSGNDAGDSVPAGAAHPKDLAVRLSMVSASGGTATSNAQIFNQGTESVSGVIFSLVAPRGVSVASLVPNRATASTLATPTGQKITLADGSTTVDYALDEPLPAASVALFQVTWSVTGKSPVGSATWLKIVGMDGADADSSVDHEVADDKSTGHNVNSPMSLDEDNSDSSPAGSYYTGQINLILTKTLASAGPFLPGTELNYALTVSNEGPKAAAAGWSIVDMLPAGLTFVDSSAATGSGFDCAAPADAMVACRSTVGLSPGQTAPPVSVKARVSDDAQPGTSVRNVAFVRPAVGDLPESNPLGENPVLGTDTATSATDNDDQQAIEIARQAPAIAVAKEACPGVCVADGEFSELAVVNKDTAVTWKITVNNPGNLPLSGVQVTDPKVAACDKSVGGLSAGGTVSYLCATPKLTTALKNLVTASGTAGSNTVTAEDTASADVVTESGSSGGATPGTPAEPDGPSLPHTGAAIAGTAVAGAAAVVLGALLMVAARRRRRNSQVG
jgi:uncharacterized repeat protein (TIGR01451 family)/LPXTG-motif cell wall-anchored protein